MGFQGRVVANGLRALGVKLKASFPPTDRRFLAPSVLPSPSIHKAIKDELLSHLSIQKIISFTFLFSQLV
jgi:hypothetical protein